MSVEYQPLKLEVVSADKMVMQCDVVNVIARTSEGDIGIWPGHEPLMAALVPCMVEVIVADGRTEILAIDGGLLAVAQGHIRVLSHEVKLAEEILLEEARKEAHELRHIRSQGEATDDQIHRLHILNAQIRAGEKYQASR